MENAERANEALVGADMKVLCGSSQCQWQGKAKDIALAQACTCSHGTPLSRSLQCGSHVLNPRDSFT